MEVYTREFYELQKDGSRRSAQQIIPLVLPLIQPKSVVDVGCGIGTWLATFRELGIEDFLGIDGEWVQKEALQIPADRFRPFDLTKPLPVERRFDLVVSVEVAEHLPADCAKTFIDSLTSLGPAVLFSAAIPHQGGNHHVNEQWPEYWLELFENKGYSVIDTLRKKIWRNDDVEWTYAQNLLLFVRRDMIEARPLLQKEHQDTKVAQLSLVHPKKYLETIRWIERLHEAAQDLTALIPADNRFILVDDHQFGIVGLGAMPFLEKNGEYWGAPPDDAAAISELERMRRSGASFIVFGWPAFWWFEYYREFTHYVRSQFPCVLNNDRIVAFDLRLPLDSLRAGPAHESSLHQ